MTFLIPSRRRWIILLIIFSAIVLNYFDRQIVSILKPALKEEFDIDDRGYAMVVNVFAVCYAISYPIVGWLVDRFGARVMMLLGIVTWSLACVGTGLTRTLGLFTGFRALLGLAEPVAFPAQLRVVAIWFPGTLRATANSVCVAGSSIGAIAAPPLVAWLAIRYNWHVAFIVPGIAGLAIATVWWFVYRDPPPEMAGELDLARSAFRPGFSWPELWRTRSLWGVLLCRFISDPVWYFCLFWLPGYFQENLGLSLAETGMVGWIPFLAADLGAIGSSAWSDWLVRRGIEPLRARKVMLTIMAALAPVCMFTPYLSHPALVLFVFSVVAVACLSWLFTLSVVVAETFPTANVGGVLGIAAGFGAAGAMVFNYYVGEAMQNLGMARMFLIMAFLHPIAAVILWTCTRPETPPER